MTFRRAFILSRANATRKAPHFPRFLNLTPGASPLSAMNSTPTLISLSVVTSSIGISPPGRYGSGTPR